MSVPHHIFMCARHWRMVPKPLREAIGQGWSMGGGSPYRANCLEAIRVVAGAEGARSAPGIEPGMKALTIWQPWASLIIMLAKPYEFRGWNFTDRPNLAKLVGRRIVIHAAARQPKADELEDILDRFDAGESSLLPSARPFVEWQLQSLRETKKIAAPVSAALGTAVIGEPVNVLKLFPDEDPDRLDPSMYGWPMTDVRQFPEPIPAAGAQGFWNWS
ncbi:hypothetical protein AFIC_001019 [[Pseudomonas] carboxydohydrogena]|uniref:Uncharacterized protein n=1 Tax=Afipia carboxydohydrogena TaxID=290 RepID=A0ABY8BRC6_AFICR|nr:hypothetical protein [[Pseudomonas] carboxydohydrogena]WEF52528.1 hypothetical protein AFIC_001019 [[Pseudomonas] carboxydohydrogena]